ncbi:hypothetical protein MTR67_047578 [Solanum verrucosum]|uniref:Uncharacterized protein n=1 Tax=Solanum verrucosum TaxID=315347 RepID=A0AAF0UZQ1_SOLVR|nr:hypothetical protein MTR67_047578 [Solanum verrucosum]
MVVGPDSLVQQDAMDANQIQEFELFLKNPPVHPLCIVSSAKDYTVQDIKNKGPGSANQSGDGDDSHNNEVPHYTHSEGNGSGDTKKAATEEVQGVHVFCLNLDHSEAASSEFNGFTHQRRRRRNRSPGPSMVVFRISILVKEKGFKMN